MNKYLVIEHYYVWADSYSAVEARFDDMLDSDPGITSAEPRTTILLASAPPRSREPKVGDIVRLSSDTTPDPDLGGEREGVVIEAGVGSDDGDCEVIFRVFATEWIQRTINKAVLEVVDQESS